MSDLHGNPRYTIIINISGSVYETRNDTLLKYPNTLLGDKLKRMKYYCPIRDEYYFNRHRKSFDSILFFYQSPGILVRPRDIDLRIFIEECKFFGIPEWAIDFMKLKEHGELREFIEKMFKQRTWEDMTLRLRLWSFLEHVDSSWYAHVFSYFNSVLFVTLILVNCLSTVKEIQPHPPPHGEVDSWILIDFTINGFFLVEFILKITITPNRKKFCKSILAWIDFIALIPFIVSILEKSIVWDANAVASLKPFQFFRVLRIFQIAKTSPGFRVTAITLRHSLDGVTLFVACLIVVVVFGGTVMYNLENIRENSAFTSIPESMWWAVQTFVTLGYGDPVPRTPAGKLFASLFVISVIPTLSIPVMTVIATFTEYLTCLNSMKDLTDDSDGDTPDTVETLCNSNSDL